VIIFPDPNDPANSYIGLQGSVGVGTPGVEFHAELTKTKGLKAEQNIFEITDGVYNAIMGW